MTPIQELLDRCARNGVRVFLKGDGLGYEAAAGISPNLKADLKERKAEIIAHLKRPAGDPGYTVVTDAGGLSSVLAGLEDAQGERVALDTETTGLSHRTDRVRLLSLAIPGGDGLPVVYLIDALAVRDLSPLWPALAGCEVVGHNLAFDLPFLARLGFTPGKVADTMLLSQVLYAFAHTKGVVPTRHGLKECVARELDLPMDKVLQKSDWSGPLSAEQLDYAADDVRVLGPLVRVLTGKIDTAGLTRAAAIESAAVPCIAWMTAAGVGFDRACWQGIAATATADVARLSEELNATAPPKVDGLYEAVWNWDSPDQVKAVLGLAGCGVESTGDEVLAGLDHPLARLLRDYRDAAKRKSTYGEPWLKHVAEDGRVYPRWVQLGANSGRMACSSPNMQNLPRGAYRKCVTAPPGKVLVKADYSQIELRIAAKVSGDQALIAAYDRGEDLHTLTAKAVLGVRDVTKAHRQLAKAINFGLVYGMGSKGFKAYAKTTYGVELTETEAAAYREAFFNTYPGLRRWHRAAGDKPKDTRTLTGRRVLRVDRFNEKLNLPVQGTGADGLKLALALLWDRRHDCPTAIPVLAVHDEIVVECPADDAGAAGAWLTTAMKDAMAPLIDPLPVEVETRVGRTWGGD